MLHSKMPLPDETLVETEQLRAEIHRMADMVSGVVRQTAVDSITTAMTIAASGTPSAPKDATRVAGELLERATVMQTEIDRFLTIAAGRSAA
ncbi:MAG TPA: hypothetical protein VHA35_11430 [Dongiaceae bacterium]|nr:hypothetical protein [Dongiaceae bacterium]